MVTKIKKIAVLMASYAQQIDSILNQNIDIPLQLFIRDDGSTDKTVSIIKEIAKNDERVTLFQSNNIGVVASFFALLKLAHDLPNEYEYFSLSDQDDVWDLDKLKIAIDLLDANNPQIPTLYGSSTRPVNQDLKPIEYKKKGFKPFDFFNTIIQIKIPGHTHVMNRALLNIVYDADPSKIYGHDAFIVNAAKICGKLIFDDGAHVSYRQHSGNQLGSSKNGRIKWIENRLSRIKKGGGAQYARQIEYVINCFGEHLTDEQSREIHRFLESRQSFWKRLKYIRRTKLYRQDSFDTLAFKVMYLCGGYNTK